MVEAASVESRWFTREEFDTANFASWDELFAESGSAPGTEGCHEWALATLPPDRQAEQDRDPDSAMVSRNFETGKMMVYRSWPLDQEKCVCGAVMENAEWHIGLIAAAKEAIRKGRLEEEGDGWKE